MIVIKVSCCGCRIPLGGGRYDTGTHNGQPSQRTWTICEETGKKLQWFKLQASRALVLFNGQFNCQAKGPNPKVQVQVQRTLAVTKIQRSKMSYFKWLMICLKLFQIPKSFNLLLHINKKSDNFNSTSLNPIFLEVNSFSLSSPGAWHSWSLSLVLQLSFNYLEGPAFHW